MTAQISDLYWHNGHEYSIAGISAGELFDPTGIGLHPNGTCSACWRGYQLIATVINNKLVIETLKINLANGNGSSGTHGPIVNNIKPSRDVSKDSWFNNIYSSVNIELPYTGGLLIADGFIRGLYVHMGFHPAWKYETVYELIFESGRLISVGDKSDQMKELRCRAVKGGGDQVEIDHSIDEFIRNLFDRSY